MRGNTALSRKVGPGVRSLGRKDNGRLALWAPERPSQLVVVVRRIERCADI